MIFLRILKESFQFAWHALVVNKLRTLLSLLGVTIGILTMVTVFAVFDSLERNIRSSVQELGNNVIYVQKWPWGGSGGEYQWWKYFQRPEPSYDDMEALQGRMTTAQELAYYFPLRQDIEFRRNTVSDATIFAVSHGFNVIWQYDMVAGRYFSDLESQRGVPVIVLGYSVAEGLFPDGRAIGKEVRIKGRKMKVIGIIEKQGSSLTGGDIDGTVLVPVKYVGSLMSMRNRRESTIMVQAAPQVELSAMRDELEGALRGIHRLKPTAENDFSLNEVSVISAALDNMFQIIGMAGLVIGGFSILVGAFGIANIMFVSVRERTNQIGIQKSMGAKNYFILLQFLLESVMLCLFGGVLGLVLVGGLLVLFSDSFGDFQVSLSFGNILQGLLISVGTGLISGFIPALLAANLDPVEAIRRGN